MNQTEVNVRDHVHGASGVSTVIDGALSSNVPFLATFNVFTNDQRISKTSAILFINAVTGDPSLLFERSSGTSVRISSSNFSIIDFKNNIGTIGATWDLSTSPGTLTLGNIPDARLTANVALKNTNNSFSVTQNIPQKLAVGFTGSPNEVLEVGNIGGGRALFGDGQGATRKGILLEGPGTIHPTYGRIDAFDYGSSSGLDLFLVASGGNVGVGIAPTAKLHVAGAGLFTGDLTVKKTTPQFILDATVGNPNLAFHRSGTLAAALNVTATNILNLLDGPSGNIRATWDLSTNPGTLTLGNIPDARLTANVALKNINNSFSVDQTISAGAFSNLLIDATGVGGAEVKFLKSGVIQSRVAANALDAITLKDGADNDKVNWDLSGTNGKLTQGDVPHGGIFNRQFTTNATSIADVTFTGVAVGDLIHVNTVGRASTTTSPFLITTALSNGPGNQATFVHEPTASAEIISTSATVVGVNASGVLRVTSVAGGTTLVIRVTTSGSGTPSITNTNISAIHYKI